jgi:5-methylcytosine-specific restriction endonuclease McrA
MPTYTDALRGYALAVMKRDKFRCRYCGLDGTASFTNWLSLSRDHLLPKGHANRDNPEFIVTACSFCNWADNRYFELAKGRGLSFEGLSQHELVRQRLPYVELARSAYREFWEQNVAPSALDDKMNGRGDR